MRSSGLWMMGVAGAVGFGALWVLSEGRTTPPPAVDSGHEWPLEPYAERDLQSHCDPTPKPGVVAFRNLVLAHFGGGDLGIGRDCSVGGPSEHKEGRAWDWAVPDHAAAKRMLAWLMESDGLRRPHARLRRAGVMYVIFDRHIWSAYRGRVWRPYTGASPHTDHMHISFSRNGAAGQTSLYQALMQVS